MQNKFYISSEKEKLNIEIIHDFLSNRSYWAKGRSIETIKKSISVFAWIMDVFILEDYRKLGIGKLLMKSVMEHPKLQGLQRWGLATTDAHGLYEKFGFKRIETPEVFMEFRNKPR